MFGKMRSMVNSSLARSSVAATVINAARRPCFDDQPRGICGRVIFDAAVRQTERIAEEIARQDVPPRVVGVGGVLSTADVRRYLAADAVQLATAVVTEVTNP
jgi:dihydroorotate dehydrogenase